MINKVAITPANVTDADGFKHVCSTQGGIYADRGYCISPAVKVATIKGCHLAAIKKNDMKDKNHDKDRWYSKMRSPYERVFKENIYRSGFTVMEIVFVLGLMAVIAAVGVTSISRWSSNIDIRSATRQLHSDLAFARSEAIKKGSNVVVAFSIVGPPEAIIINGYTIFLDNGAGTGTPGNGVQDGGEPVLRTDTFAASGPRITQVLPDLAPPPVPPQPPPPIFGFNLRGLPINRNAAGGFVAPPARAITISSVASNRTYTVGVSPAGSITTIAN